MAITSVSNTVTQSDNDFVYNPNSQLDKDAFMQLFLKELEMQDPTDPMDTDKMLEQTAYLSTMEMNQNMQTTLDNLSKTLQTNSELGAISAIGKIGDTGYRYINVTDDDNSVSFDLYFGDDISSGKVEIKDKNGNVVRTFPLEAHTKGVLNFDWDLTNDAGERVPSDTYEVTATYTSPDGSEHTTALGAYPIESIKFENGEPYAKLGSNYLPFSEIKEIYEWQG
ncbi:FlgD immunoglobulin-like domain containing protein [Caminibacter pacificus]|uniref:Basal-body rod modification protein FlgD n=1 Tax=Caminibacter pacificus TaxID=1424653 RepID=A0AAJ4RC58_9BACT|nr:FlgD immunoglobulin-like domain containing protein [Caminibacter pacificus]NPA88185.1 flagellar hook capping protein [Campylobacterota bacterium]QCI28890.1 flagellar hook capping protein [Caminibacter pacificus]ROR39481.1 flagellar basal-body rod modification protein FlgD [Caminibacter pacificus]